MILLHNNPELKQTLISKGFARKDEFSWEIMAERLSKNMLDTINVS
jgi:hypothetical protein